MENNISKPITLIYEEFKKELKDLINNSTLPPFILEPILRDAYNRVKIAEQQQLEKDRQYYQELLSDLGKD